MPLPEFYKVVEDMKVHLGSDVVRCCGYGHIGDGNLHFNVTSTEFSKVSSLSLQYVIFLHLDMCLFSNLKFFLEAYKKECSNP